MKRPISRLSILFMLVLVFICTSMSTVLAADGDQYAIFPIHDKKDGFTLNITQSYGSGGHGSGRTAIDFGGKIKFYAPFDCKIVDSYPTEARGNTIVLRSLNKVKLAGGGQDYVNIMMAHAYTADLKALGISLAEGTVFKQGQCCYIGGNTGTSSGNHIHIETSTGAFGYDSNGFLKNRYAPDKIFFVDPSKTNWPLDASYPGTAMKWVQYGHSLTVKAATGGSILKGTSGVYTSGAKVSLTAQAAYGYNFSKWTSSNGGTFSDAKSASCTFTMPDKATTVTAEFIENPFMAKANWNTASATNITQNNAQLNGALRVTKSAFSLASFAMPSVTDLYCFASRSQAEVTSATPTSHGGAYYVRYAKPTYESDSDGRTYVRSITSLASLKNDAGAALNLQPGETCYFKWVAVVENAPVTSSVGSFKLLSTASSWYQLESNTSNGMFSGRMRYSSSQRMVEAGCFVSPNRTLVMNATRSNKNGTALKIDKASSGFEYGTVGSDRFTMVFYKAPPYDTIKTFLPGVTYYFKFYGVTSDGNVTYSAISSYTPPALSTYLFTVAASVGGQVTAGTSGNYAPGNILSLIVTPEEGYVFKGWTTTAGELSDALSSSCSFTMPATAATVTAIFAPAEYSVNVLASNGGKVDTSVNGSYTAGSSVNLKATPDAGYRFVGWSSNAGGTFANAEKSTTAFTVPASNVTIVAEFEEDVSSITFPQGQYQLELGKTLALTATILPESQKNAVLTWKSSDPSTASVDANGVVTAISEGSVTITATAANGVSASCTIKVQLLGDANNDGKVDAADALIILQYSAGWNVTVNTAKADVTGDGVIGISDALKILQDCMGGDIVSALRTLQRMLADLGLSSLEITLQPADQYVTAGEDAAFTVAATGDGLQYQWYINRNDGAGWKAISGAASSTCSIENAGIVDDGCRFYCAVTAADGTQAISLEAALHVSPAIELPMTGDVSDPMLWAGMLATSLAGILLLSMHSRKKAC